MSEGLSSTAPNPTKVDVLVIGAGPAGLMCAIALAQAGVNVKIIDQMPSPVTVGHADGIMPRTMEVLESYGLAEPISKIAKQNHMFAFYNTRKDGKGIERTERKPVIAASDARYPFATTLHQGSIEALLNDALNRAGTAVDRPVRPSKLVVTADEVVLNDPSSYPIEITLDHLEKGTKQEVVQAKFVLGADGAHSWVRKTLGIAMEGEHTNHVWGVIDLSPSPDSDFPDWKNGTTINAPNITLLCIPREETKTRIYIELGTEGALRDETGRVDLSRFTAEKLLQIAMPAFAPYSMNPTGVEWWTCYVVGQRVAAEYAAHNRVFIAGDACHTHSPKAGQGMNASMNDSHNLAWKLIYVLRGWADISILETYETERRPFAQQLIAFDKWFAAGFSTKAREEIFQDNTEEAPLDHWDRFRKFGGLTSGVGVHYNPSTIISSSNYSSKLTVGERLPPQILLYAADYRPIEIQLLCPSNTRFKIFIFCGDLAVDARATALNALVKDLFGTEAMLGRLPDGALEIFVVMKGKKETADYMQVPKALRPSWDRVFLDDVDTCNRQGGVAYDSYGIGEEGALVVVRPDGYVALVAGMRDVERMEKYFKGFMVGVKD